MYFEACLQTRDAVQQRSRERPPLSRSRQLRELAVSLHKPVQRFGPALDHTQATIETGSLPLVCESRDLKVPAIDLIGASELLIS